MHDYPDHTRLFHLVGTEITIPINIEASDVTIPVSIKASAVTVNVRIVGQLAWLYVTIAAVSCTLHVNIHSQTANIDFNFADQAVAVFDAAKWFAHQAQHVFVLGSDTQNSGAFGTVASRVIDDGTTYFITYVSGGYNGETNAHVAAYLSLPGGITIRLDGTNGVNAIFDTPLSIVGPAVVELYMAQWSGGSAQMVGGFGGYDEID